MSIAVSEKHEISLEIYKFFADYIYNHSGMTYLEKDYYRLETRLRSLVKLFELKSVNEVFDLYQGSVTPDMHAVLINISTNNETYFFRDIVPFKILTEYLIPNIQETKAVGTINVWSAAASTGQEIYSILMSLSEKYPDLLSKMTFEASDISCEALDKAKLGLYNGLDVQRGLPIAQLMKYFEQLSDENWQVKQEFTRKVNFFKFNLLKEEYPKAKYDIIYCRNVLIYQDMPNKQLIVNKLYASMKPGGYLVLGNGESFIGLETKLKRETFNNLTVYRREP
ncbi:hypothetical protein A9Q84_08460 [Halobacteriovorax marinus]|uniref:protein-glutamate O-methyltransferase n=1 Tax=Halobacteriovorax marinus TaxID=97084 RepID=A0A1Y5F6L4_9BACT|nr:hypothetical protein A9Q84_08460 [Halobacteriovorax marinus]